MHEVKDHCGCYDELAALKKQNSALIEALEKIKSHQEFVAGNAITMSATYRIAKEALSLAKEKPRCPHDVWASDHCYECEKKEVDK